MKALKLIQFLSFILFAFVTHNALAGELFKNGLTLKLAFVMPESGFGKFNNDFGRPDADGRILYEQYTAYPGFGLQLGKMYFITSLNEDETMKLGLDVTWLGLSYQNVTYNTQRTTMHHISVFPELGPSFSYSPAESMAIDVAFKLTPTIGIIGGQFRDIYLGGENWLKGSGFGLRYTPALNFRYKKYLVGVEYSLGNMGFNYNIPPPTRSSVHNLSGHFTSGTSPYSTLRVVLGFKF